MPRAKSSPLNRELESRTISELPKLLARKRPFDTSFISCDAVEADSPAEENSSNKRVPLMEISTNTTTPFYLKALKPVIDDCVTDSFITPAKQTGCLGLADCSSTPGLLDDDNDFDESVLKEIDAICEQNSAVKAEETSPNIVAELKTCASFGEDVNVEDEDEFQCGDMPEEYLKSLNERQREAACSDISVPLMIAAGPGSGKTSTMVGRILKLISEVFQRLASVLLLDFAPTGILIIGVCFP